MAAAPGGFKIWMDKLVQLVETGLSRVDLRVTQVDRKAFFRSVEPDRREAVDRGWHQRFRGCKEKPGYRMEPQASGSHTAGPLHCRPRRRATALIDARSSLTNGHQRGKKAWPERNDPGLDCCMYRPGEIALCDSFLQAARRW